MKIILCGAMGRMGRAIAECAKERGDEIACGVDIAEGNAPFPLYANLESAIEKADVLIDFSSPNGLGERLAFAQKRRLPFVLGTTGYGATDELLIRDVQKEIPIFRSGNFSLGIGLLQFLTERAAHFLSDFDAEIVERHHNRKKDAPSGTALMLANAVTSARGKAFFEVYGRHGACGARRTSEIGIHAVRGGNIIGEHEVMFAGEDEIVTLTHSARSRKIFAVGALRAAAWVVDKPAGSYDMRDLLQDIMT